MLAQIFAVVIFLTMFVMIVADKIERHIVTLAAGALTMILVFGIGMHSFDALKETLNLHALLTKAFWYNAGTEGGASTGINWETIIFIAGMMIMVEGMAESGFFRWLCMRLAKTVNYKPLPIFIAFMVLSAVLSMFIDSITVILFLAAVTIELANMLKFEPIPFVLAEIFCANLGGSATMCGDPPNIIIGTSLGYTFMDFLNNTGLVAGICLIVTVFYFLLVFGKKIRKETSPVPAHVTVEPRSVITNKVAFGYSCVVFAIAIVLLVTHARTGLTVATIGFLVAFLTIFGGFKYAEKVLKHIDYKTLLFFIGLFIVIGGLEQTGVLEIIANFIGSISGGNVILIVAIIIWLSAIASALIDNIPFAATMIPVIRSLAATTGMDLHVLAWSLAIGTDIGGSATPIGASANVVGISTLNKNGHKVSWGRYCKIMIPITVIVIAISTGYLFIRYL